MSQNLQFSGLHAHLWAEPQDGVFHGVSQDDRQTHGSQAERYWAEAAGADAREDCGHSGVAPEGGAGVFPISRGTGQRAAAEIVPQRRASQMAEPASAAKSKESLDVGTISGAARRLAAASRDPATVARRAVCGQASEVGTVCVRSASTGLCGGCRATGIPTATGGLSGRLSGRLCVVIPTLRELGTRKSIRSRTEDLAAWEAAAGRGPAPQGRPAAER